MPITQATERNDAWRASPLKRSGVAVLALATALASTPAQANPAGNAASFSQTTAGAVSTTVPDGTCSAITSTRGGAGASSGVAATNGGRGGAGAVINARFSVLPGQAVTGAVASGGALGTTSLTAPNNGTGTANGGSGGTATGTLHRGGGGGGSSSISVAGLKLVEAGGGGGGGASHGATTLANGGGGGFTGIAPGTVAPGTTGTVGFDSTTPTPTVGGGKEVKLLLAVQAVCTLELLLATASSAAA